MRAGGLTESPALTTKNEKVCSANAGEVGRLVEQSEGVLWADLYSTKAGCSKPTVKMTMTVRL